LLALTDLPPKELAKKWSALLTVAAEGYWSTHSDFGKTLGGPRPEVALVGDLRASDTLVNIALPLFVARAEREGIPALREKALAVYAACPRLAENNITRAMAEEAFGPRAVGAVTGARRQQGLIHLYRLYCQSRRCYECPLSGILNVEF